MNNNNQQICFARKPMLIAGPTASGKSYLAKELALRLNGVVINADSMQVYQELRVLTARPSVEDEQQVPHRLYGFVPACRAYSIGLWLKDMEKSLTWAVSENLRPIIVGGTGLYFMGLTEGLSDVPAISPAIRHHWRGEGARFGAVKLHKVLQARDPLMAEKLVPSDSQRIIRALEVLDQTGRSLHHFQMKKNSPLLPAESCHCLSLMPARDWLYKQINMRFDQLVAGGAVEEVQALMAQNLVADLPAMGALGVPQITDYLQGTIALQQAIDSAKQATRRYAKRQFTWQKRNNITWKRINSQQMEKNIKEIVLCAHKNS